MSAGASSAPGPRGGPAGIPPRIDTPSIVREIVRGAALPARGLHGIAHWGRVLENGLRIAAATGADAEVVTLFALFHDARRLTDGRDHGHGLRGGELAGRLRGRLVPLADAAFELLFEACRLHTDGRTAGDPTLQACWDADRLDLGRVGVIPLPERLCTDAARRLLGWAHERALRGHEPAFVGSLWLAEEGGGKGPVPRDGTRGAPDHHRQGGTA